jgi:tetratricopeptide (TPR) repeat protein
MKRFVFAFLFFYGAVFAQSPFSDAVDSLILKGIDLTLESRFDSALAVFRSVQMETPDHPVGLFYQAATLQSEMMDYETDRYENEFYQYIDSALVIGERRLDQGDSSSWTHFYVGSAYSYKGLYQVKSGAYVPGFISANKGVGHLRKAMKQDSTLYDAYLGVGNYQYWSGRLSKYLRWLPFIRDERDEGIRNIHLAIEKGAFSKWVSINSLAWIEYDREEYAEALRLFRLGLEPYPESRFFLWGAGSCLFRIKRWQDAVEIYEGLLDSVLYGKIYSGYNEAECRLRLAGSYFGLGDYEKSLRECDAILSLKPDEKTGKRIRDHRKEALKIREQCLEEMKRR